MTSFKVLTAFALVSMMGGLLASDSPYGVCEHLNSKYEHKNFGQVDLDRTKECGIGWLRADFSWQGAQPEKGKWNFDVMDESVKWADERGIRYLPILDYDTPWASPAHKHMDEWLEYVRTIVTRYKDKMRYWEVWNEQNSKGFWRDMPSPAAYAEFLKATYLEIKKVDPDLKVLIGGFAGMPFDFIDGVYAAGAKDYFDVMNVHPYRKDSPEKARLLDDLNRLKSIMAKYGDSQKPIWFTEIGYPTHKTSDISDLLVFTRTKAEEIIAPEKKTWKTAVIIDPSYPDGNYSMDLYTSVIGSANTVTAIKLADLKAATLSSFDMLVMPPTENFPVEYFDEIEKYLQNGGSIFFWNMMPLYYALKNNNGKWESSNAPESFRERLGIGWEAEWTRQGVPSKASKICLDKSIQGDLKKEFKSPIQPRFLLPCAKKKDSVFIPILNAVEASYSGAVSAVYKAWGDRGGAVIVTSLRYSPEISEKMQADFLARTLLISFNESVEKIFWYELRAPQANPVYNEDHFGILNKDQTAKPAYIAYKNFIKARPAASEKIDGRVDGEGILFSSWRRPDGQNAWAFWSANGTVNASLEIKGKLSGIFDSDGKDLSGILSTDASSFKLDISGTPVYIIGPDAITVK